MSIPNSPLLHRPVRYLVLAIVCLATALLPLSATAQEDTDAPVVPQEQIEAQEEVLSSPTTFAAAEGGGATVLSVQSRPEGARVFVDGEEHGVTPVYVKGLEDGSHEVILYLPDHGAFRQTIEGRGGRIFVDLEAGKGLGVGFVAIHTEPPDARVEVDGERVGLSPLEVPMEAGTHTVRVSKDGFKDAETGVEVEAESRQRIALRLEPREGAMLVISSPVGAEVLMDGEPVGSAWEPLRIEDVSPGVHAVLVRKDGYRSWKKDDVMVRSAETATVLAALQPERDYSWVRLFTAPPDARVWLDGQELGVAGAEGLGFKASKGAHRLYLEVDPAVHPGFEALELTVSLTEDEVDYSANPLRLPPVDENFTHAVQLVERGQLEEALGFLDRVDTEHPSFGEARLLVVEVLRDLDRASEVPAELEVLLAIPRYRNNPTLNTALGYWALVAARSAPDREAAAMLGRAVEALDRAVQAVDLYPPAERDQLILKAHYYTGMASEILFNITGEKRYVKKGAQAWEVFFARLEISPDALKETWIEKARTHRRSMEFLAKKLGG